jgi:hypothetical protein
MKKKTKLRYSSLTFATTVSVVVEVSPFVLTTGVLSEIAGFRRLSIDVFSIVDRLTQ